MKLGKYFDSSEFACKCGCGFDTPDPLLIELLDEIREIMGKPLVINSGCRCATYNAKVKGEANSAHMIGTEADIAMPGSTFRYVFLRLAFPRFKRIGIYKTFVHVGVSEKHPQNVCWVKE